MDEPQYKFEECPHADLDRRGSTKDHVYIWCKLCCNHIDVRPRAKIAELDEAIKKMQIASTEQQKLAIKILDEHKELIREIQFPTDEQIHAICFIDYRGDLIIGHGQRQSIIFAHQYLKGARPINRGDFYRSELK